MVFYNYCIISIVVICNNKLYKRSILRINMKHNLQVTLIILFLFLASQLIGLEVTKRYLINELPYGIERPEFQNHLHSGHGRIF